MYQSAGTIGGMLPSGLSAHWYNAADFAPGNPWNGFAPARTALVLVDLINWQVDPDGPSIAAMRAAGHDDRADHLLARFADTIAPNLALLLPAARRAGVRVVHARLASRHPDYADVVPALRPYVKAAGALDGSPGAAPIAEVGDEPGDLSIVKSGSGAFGGTELDFLLRREGIDTILYAGVVTTACVLLSVAAGFDLGYRQYLVADCTGTLSARDQEDAERLIGNYLAEIVTAADAVAAMEKQSHAL